MVRLKEAARTGQGPTTLAEKREIAQAERETEKSRRKAESYRLITFGDYWRQHYLAHARWSRKQTSCAREEQHFRTWLEPAFGHLPIEEIGLRQWDGLMRNLDKAGHSQRTKEYITGTGRRVLRHAQERGLKVEVPTGKQIGATAPKNNRRLRVITPKEARDILAALEERDPRAARVTRFAFLTGCRPSETLNLKWGHVAIGSGELVFMDTKNKESRRLPLTPALEGLFAQIERGPDESHVFLSQRTRWKRLCGVCAGPMTAIIPAAAPQLSLKPPEITALPSTPS